MAEVGIAIMFGALVLMIISAGAWGIWEGWMDRLYGGAYMMAFGAFMLVFGVGAAFAVLAKVTDDSPTLSLRAQDWACTDTETYTAVVMVGKIAATQVRRRCIQYTQA